MRRAVPHSAAQSPQPRGPTGSSRCLPLAAQDGFTIIELVVAMALALVVFSATLLLLTGTMRAQGVEQSRVTQLEEAQVAIQQLVRNLRQASSVTVNSPMSISYTTPASQSVTFTCSTSTNKCVSGTTTVVTDFSSTDTSVFTGSPNSTSPTYIGINLVISATNHTTVTLTDGVGLRNVLLGS